MKQIALQQFLPLGLGQMANDMRGQLLGVGEWWIKVVFKPQRHHKRRPALSGIHALAVQICHGVGDVVTGRNTGLA